MTRKSIFVGYNVTSKDYWIDIPALRNVVVRWDVKFKERALRRLKDLGRVEKQFR